MMTDTTSTQDRRPGALFHFVEAEASRPPVTLPLLGTIVVVCSVLYLARDLFLPMALGMLLAFILSPLVTLLRRKTGLGDTTAVLTTVFLAGASVLAFVGVVTYQIAVIGSNLPTYQGNVLMKIDSLLQAGNDNDVVERLRTMVDNISARIEASPEEGKAASPGNPAPSGDVVEVAVVERMSFLEMLETIVLPIVGPVAVFGLIWVIVIFALLERSTLRDKLVQMIGGSNILATSRLLAEAGGRVSQYLVAQLLVNVIYAVPIWLGLTLIGVPNALFFGLVTLVMRFVPFIGSTISAVLPLLMAFAVSPDWSLVLWTAALFLVVELLTSNVIEPWFYGQRTGLSSLSVIVAAMFWTWLWGPMGLIIATPLTVCLVVLGNHVPSMRIFAVLLGDRPGLDPSKQLYDRLLLGNRVGSSDNAALGSSTAYLSEYYDQTAIPALALAQADFLAGLLNEGQAQRVAHGAERLVEEMEAVVEEERTMAETAPDSPVSTSEETVLNNGVLDGLGHRVLVLGAQTALEEAAAHLIAQAMRAEGADAQVTSFRSLRAGELAQSDAGAVVVVSLAGTDSQTLSIRHRQIRRANPATPVYLSLWGKSESSPSDLPKDLGVQVRGMAALFSTVFGQPVAVETANSAS